MKTSARQEPSELLLPSRDGFAPHQGICIVLLDLFRKGSLNIGYANKVGFFFFFFFEFLLDVIIKSNESRKMHMLSSIQINNINHRINAAFKTKSNIKIVSGLLILIVKGL